MTEGPVEPGDVLSNKFRVERVLGVGGMGAVVAASVREPPKRDAGVHVAAPLTGAGGSLPTTRD